MTTWFDQMRSMTSGGDTAPGGLIGNLTPQQPATPGAHVEIPGVIPGWDATKWNDRSHQSIKYRVGRILARYPPTSEGLRQAIPALQAEFPGLTFDGKDSITIPGGGPIDVLQGASSGGVAWQWLTSDNQGVPETAGGLPGQGLPSNSSPFTPGSFYGGGGGSSTSSGGSTPSGAPSFTGLPSFQGPALPSATAPYVPSAFTPGTITPGQGASPFTYTGPGLPGEYTPTGPLNAAKTGPTLERRDPFTYDPLKTSEAFVLPTGQDALTQDPGYQFRLSQGIGALENSAAAKGLLRTGGTLKGIQDFGQQAASQEYGNAVARARDTYGLNQSVRQSEQAQQFGQGLSSEQQNAAQRLNEFNAQLASQGQEFQQAATQQGINEAQRIGAFGANLTRQQQGFGQGLSQAQLNTDSANRIADRQLNADTINQANLIAANQANNAFGFQAASFNADQTQQGYRNAFEAATTARAFDQTENLARNAQAMTGYQTDVSRDLAQQGINLTADQNRFMNQLNGQQQQFMQLFMLNGQSFDQAYKLLLARLQYPA